MSKPFSYSYFQGKIRETKNAKISIQCKAIQYGLGCFTGVRGNWSKKEKNLYLFRLEDHYKRLKEAAEILGMKFDFTFPKFKKIIIDLIKKNKAKEDIYLRLTLYSAATTLTPRFDNPDDDFAAYMISLKDYFNTAKGLNVFISKWRRFDNNMIPIKAKSTGSYVNAALAKTEAIKKGYDEAIFLNRHGNVCETPGANIFGIKNAAVITPPLKANNLNGITRRSLIELFKKEFNIKVKEKNIHPSRLHAFDELLLCGTAAKISWIRSVNKKLVGGGKKGPFTEKLEKLFNRITCGQSPKYKKWLTAVY